MENLVEEASMTVCTRIHPNSIIDKHVCFLNKLKLWWLKVTSAALYSASIVPGNLQNLVQDLYNHD